LAVAGAGKTIKALFKVNRRECEISICSPGYLYRRKHHQGKVINITMKTVAET
jgi:hypothetical protein